jgi:hypothetical protein
METIGSQKIWTFPGRSTAIEPLTCSAIRKACA